MKLLKIYRRFENQRNYIELLCNIALRNSSNVRLFEAYLNYSAIRLHDEWSIRCRELILRSAEGGVTTRSGNLINKASSIGKENCPLKWVRDNWTSKKVMDKSWEPRWYDPSQAIRVAKLLNIQNLSSITNGLGLSIAPLRIRIVRNVIVHSLPETWKKFKQLEKDLGLSPGKPCNMLSAIDKNVGSRYYNIWAEELRSSIWVATE